MKAAGKLAQKMIDTNIISQSDAKIYEYGIENSFLIFINLLTSLIIGILTGKLIITIIFLIFFMTLRSFTGGFHLNSKLMCYFLSNLLLLVPIFGQRVFYQFTTGLSREVILAIIIAVIVGLAPVECMKRKYDDLEKKVFRKRSLIILTIQVIIYHLFVYWGTPEYSFAIYASFFIVALLLSLGKLDLKIHTK